MRLKTAWWVAPCLLLPALLAAPFAAGRTLLFRDIIHFVLPQQAYAAAAVAAGRLPLWDPGRYGGTPFFAEPGSGILYPPNLVFHLLDPGRAATLFVLLHLPIAAAGTYLLARHLSLQGPAAALAAAGYTASGYLLSMHGGHYYLASAALLPGLVAALLRARGPRSLATGAALVALAIFNGEYQALFFAGLFAFALAFGDSGRRARAAASVGASLALGAALGAVQLVPTLYFARGTVRGEGLSVSETGSWALHPLRWIEWVVPAPFGLPWPENGYWGTAFVSGEHHLPWAISLFLGPALVIPALSTRWPREGRRLALIAVCAASLLLAAGTLLPFFRAWVAVIPLADRFRYAEKYALPATLALCLMGAWAAQELVRAPGRAVAGFSVCGAVLAAGAIGSWVWPAWLASTVERGLAGAQANLPAAMARAQLAGSLAQGALVCGALAAGAAASRKRPAVFVPLLLAATLLTQGAHGLDLLSWGDGSFLRREPVFLSRWRAALAPGTTGRVLNDGTCAFDGRGEGSLLERERAFQWDTGKENFPLLFGLREALGYGAVENRRQVELVHQLLPSGMEATARAMGASAILGCGPRGLRVTPLSDPLPRLAVDGDAARATLLEDLPEHARIRARGPGLLVFAETDAPGWTASIDGAPAAIAESGVLFRSVRVPPGEHEVTFDYAAPGLRAGAIVSALALLACLALLAGRRVRRGASPGQTSKASTSPSRVPVRSSVPAESSTTRAADG